MAETNRPRNITRVTRKGRGFPVPGLAYEPPGSPPDRVWVVDWDIPAADKAARQRFYRRLRYIWLNYYGDTRMSTMSVLITDEEDLAREVYSLARKYGRANLYEARPVSK